MPFLGRFGNRQQQVAGLGLGTELHLNQDTTDVYEPGDAGLHLGNLQEQSSARQKYVCGNPECSSSWSVPWRSRRRPVFESQWGCSGRCLQSIVRAAVRREHGGERRNASAPQPHRHRVPLGLVMLAQGWITNPQLQQALNQQRTAGTGRIGDWLVNACGLDTEQVTRGLSVQWGCPVFSTDGFDAQAMALVLPEPAVQEFGMVPLRAVGNMLYLGCEDRPSPSVAFAAERMSGLKTETGLVESKAFQAAREALAAANNIPCEVAAAADLDALTARVSALLEDRQPLASRLVRMHQYFWLRLWLESGTRGTAGDLPGTHEDMQDYLFTLGGQA
ncbi:MAG: hypothetical protein KGK08_08835 [Acidobacteriota bacterium]|nr:hypothetical protein [Acidobacteriota bacterium]